MRTHFEHDSRPKSQRVADLKNQTAELERRLADARVCLDRELAQPAYGRAARYAQPEAGYAQPEAGYAQPEAGYAQPEAGYGYNGSRAEDSWFAGDPFAGDPFAGDPFAGDPFAGDPFVDRPVAGRPVADGASADGASADGAFADDPVHPPHERTEVLVNQGRRTASHKHFSRWRKMAAGAAVAAIFLTGLAMILFQGGASWPPSVAVVQSEAARACQNPDVKSEPGQVNFACAMSTRQVLWAFALMTSADDPDFADAKTGRVGLEPITPDQGGEVAWSLNLHHPYSPANPIDSLEVAARAINNIIGGATLTGPTGTPVVQSGLEGRAGNCLRYTGSAVLISRAGYPRLCAKPVTSLAGQAALVADVYQKWVVGAAPEAAQNAAVLFENAQNPGDPRVQAILRQLALPAA